MVDLSNFNSNSVAPMQERGAIPAGWYIAIIESTEEKPTKANDGSYLEVVHQIIDGQYKGAKVWTILNLNNQNPQAVEIAYSELSAIYAALGLTHVQTSQQLHNIPHKIKLKVTKDRGGEYEDRNQIQAYKHISFETPQAGGIAQRAAAAAPMNNVPPAQPPQPWNQQQQAPAYPPQQAPQQAPAYMPPQQPAQQFAPPQQPAQPAQYPPQQAAPAQPWMNNQPQQQAPVQQAPEQQQFPPVNSGGIPPWQR